MKSYQEHLKTLLNLKPTSVTRKASAIFPFFVGGDLKTKLIFLNYWHLKRNIQDIQLKVVLRDSKGRKLLTKQILIDQIKAYELDLKNWFFSPYPVSGSIEVHFTSKENLVFPYPAVTVVYSSNDTLSFVHAAQRVYDNQENVNLDENKEFLEAGFNIYLTDSQFPFVTLINGAQDLQTKALTFQAINSKGSSIHKTFELQMSSYTTTLFELSQWRELKEHLNNKPGMMKIKLFNTHSFPRLIVGNYDQPKKALSVTHTYYDLSQASQESDYWPHSDSDWYPMTLSLPLMEDYKLFSKVYFYPIYSPCSFWVDCEIRSTSGTLLKTLPKIIKVDPGSFQCLSLEKHLKHLPNNEHLSMRLIAYSCSDKPIAARLKVGYDVGFKKEGLASNVCTNFAPANPSLLEKKSAFRWAPLMPAKQQGSIWCLNGSNLKNYSQQANVRLTYYRSQDTKTLNEQVTIAPQGHHVVEHSKKTEEFLQNSIGWCTFESDNPFISTYYFAFSKQYLVGADHGF